MLAFINKTKTCTILANQITLSVPRNEEKNVKNNSIRNNIHEIWSKICFVHAVNSVWTRFLSSEMAQITDNFNEEKTATSNFLGLPNI